MWPGSEAGKVRILWSLALCGALGLAGCRTAVPGAGGSCASDLTYDHGGIVRGPRDSKQLALVFTGGEFGEGAEVILNALQARGVRGSMFVTGDFIRKPEHQSALRRIVAEGHYLGPHSDSHPLYCSWEDRSKLLVTEAQFRADLEKNLSDLTRYGVPPERMRFFMPPFEWYNEQIVAWARQMGLVVVNFTPGTRSNADYMPDDHPRFVASEAIYASVLDYEAGHPEGLNGFMLLFHLGSGPGRTDKMYVHVGRLVDELSRRGYAFVRVDELLACVSR